MNILKSAFEKLSADNLNSIKTATEISAAAVSPGGSLFGVATEMLASLKRIEKGLVKSESRKESSMGGGKVGSAILMSIIGGKALTTIGKGLSVIVDAINKLQGDSKEITEKMQALTLGIDSIVQIGPSILKFAGYMFLATPLLIIGAIAAPLFGLSLFIITKTLAWAAKPLASKPVQEALTSMKDVGMGILVLGGALALALPLYSIGIVALPLVALTLLTIGGVFYLLDKLGVDKSMKDVAKAFTFVGLSIVALGLSIFAFDYFMNKLEDPMNTLLTIGAVILGLGVAFFIAGKMASSILKGALVMAVSAIPLILIGFGVKIFADSIPKDNPWEFMAQIGVFIVGLGVAMAAAGAAAPLILPGAAAMGVAGLALIAIAKGASSMGEFFKSGLASAMLEDSGEVTEAILGFGGGRKMSRLEYFMLTIARSFTLYPNQIASMYASAPALIMAGLALISIAKGIERFQGLKIDYETLPINISNLLTSISKPFQAIGETYSGGFLTGSTPAERGIKAVSGMGNALSGIAIGVQSMAMLKFPVYGTGKNATKIVAYRELKPADFTQVGLNIGQMVSSLTSVFAEIGKNPDAESTWWGGNSNIENGMEMVSGMAQPLNAIANITKTFANLKVEPNSVALKIKSMVKSLSDMFSSQNENEKINEDEINIIGTLGDNLKKVADTNNGFEKFKKSYGEFVDHHIRFKDSVNGFDKENLKLTSEMFNGLAALSNTNGAIEQMGDQMAAAIEKLAQMIEDAKSTIAGGNTELTNSTNELGNKISGMSTGGSTTVQQSTQDNSQLISTLQQLLERFDEPIPVKVRSSSVFN